VGRVFVSHSTADKADAFRLASELAQHDIPIWIDSREIDIGESLTSRISEGIDKSTWFLLLVSPNSLASGWVAKELNAARSKERQLDRTLILPVLIQTAVLPGELSDRLYVDLSDGYLQHIERLVSRLKDDGYADDVSITDLLVPLTLTRGKFLSKQRLESRMDSIKTAFGPSPTRESSSIQPSQMLLPYDESYMRLRSKLARRIERFDTDDYYSPQLFDILQSLYDEANRADSALRVYLASILNLLLGSVSVPFSPIDACYWVTLLFRTVMLSDAFAGQSPDDVELEDYAKGPSIPMDPENGLWDYEGDTRRFDIFTEAETETSAQKSFGVDLPLQIDDLNSFVGPPIYPPEWVKYRLSSSTISKFVVPAMVWNHFRQAESPLTWTFEDYWIGLA
jgi:hypothetical protein